MKKRMLAALLALMLCAVAAAEAAQEPASPEAAQETAAPEAVAPVESDEAAAEPAKGYVLVSTASWAGWLPLPNEGEISYPLRQVLPDGTEAVNVIHLTPDGVYMEDSTCEGHDCVQQGEVTLENRDERILSNMIICLPNQVFLQLFTPEELLAMTQVEQ